MSILPPAMIQTDSQVHSATIRHARLEDIDIVTQLVHDLADSVGLLDHVEATADTLARTLCLEGQGEQDASIVKGAIPAARPARCLLLSDRPGGAVVGFAIYYYTYSTWLAKPGVFLEDLYVRPQERGKGYGKQLLVAVARKVDEMGGGRLDWDVLKCNEKALKFYESVGAKRRDEWLGMRLEGEALRSLADLKF